ncbi:MAG TPA: hypothetical protein VKE88_00545 [Candidatus Nanoarchaeia archaeon]|nr:hypothetical protein [Candidatus Nanoarchaeia archaeon]
MSDAFTDMARTHEQTRSYESFMELLVSYLSKPSDDCLIQLRNAASHCTAIPGSFRGQYPGREATVSDCLDGLLSSLGSKDKRLWADVLHTFQQESCDDRLYSRLNTLSPFAGKIIVKAYRGHGFISVDSSGIEKALDKRLGREDHEEYFVAISEEDLQKLI